MKEPTQDGLHLSLFCSESTEQRFHIKKQRGKVLSERSTPAIEGCRQFASLFHGHTDNKNLT